MTLEAIEQLAPGAQLRETTPIGTIEVAHVVSTSGTIHRWRVRHGRGMAHLARTPGRAYHYVRQSRLLAGVYAVPATASTRSDASDADTVEDPCLALLDPVDAMAVGQSLRMLARQAVTEPGAKVIYARVGQALVDAAQRKLAERTERGQ